MTIVFVTDMGYLLPTQVAIASICARAYDVGSIRFVVLDCGIEDEAWDRFVLRINSAFGGSVKLCRKQVDTGRFAGLRLYRGSVGTYARILIPELLQDIDHCLYLDGDVLFLDDVFRIEELYDAKYAIMGHSDNKDTDAMDPLFKSWGISWDPDSYVNAGVLFMNLNWMRKNDFSKRCIEYLNLHPDTPHVDQDAINIICKGYSAMLPNEWGVFNTEAFAGETIPKCVHYAVWKPWQLAGNTRSLMTVDQYWYRDAKKYLGLVFAEIGVSRWRYYKRLAWSVVHRAVLLIARFCPALERRYGWQRKFFAH